MVIRKGRSSSRQSGYNWSVFKGWQLQSHSWRVCGGHDLLQVTKVINVGPAGDYSATSTPDEDAQDEQASDMLP